MYYFFILNDLKAKSLGQCTKHKRSLVSVTLERPSLNYPLNFLTVFLETEALLFCQLTKNCNTV